MLDDVLPHILRQVGVFVTNGPVVEHFAERLAGPIEKCLFLLRQLRRRIRHQAIPVRHAGKQFAVPPDITGLERLAFGIRHRWQHLSIDVEQWFGKFFAPYLDQVRHDHQAEYGPQNQQPVPCASAEIRIGGESKPRGNCRCAQVNALIREKSGAADKQQQPEKTDSDTEQESNL